MKKFRRISANRTNAASSPVVPNCRVFYLTPNQRWSPSRSAGVCIWRRTRSRSQSFKFYPEQEPDP